jgi:hypothetical protein
MMELILKRAYFSDGTNGALFYDEQFICFTIERPWKGNRRRISCIPEGRYHLGKRFTEKRGWHLVVDAVPGRSFILFHPANDALKELEGCIAPVTSLTGVGIGASSRRANERLKKVVFEAMLNDENTVLTIQNSVL